MDMKKLFLLFALLCAVAQGALSQISYPILSNDVWDGKSQAMPQFYDRFEGKTAVVVINTCAELAYIASHWSETTGYAHPVYGKKCFNEINYLLNANLDMTRESWKPLGRGSNSDTPFEGTLYGNCHTIFLRISNPDTNNQGLIAQIGSHGTVMDLHLAGSIDAGNSRKVGGITGLNYGTISGCWVSADVKSSYYSIIYDADLGGIAGWNYDGLIEYCCMTGNVVNTGGGSGVGGIAGSNDKDIQECAFYGTVTSKYNNDNKFVGDQNARCSNVTDIFEADIYRRGSGWPVFSFAYKYPYVMNISGSGPGAIEASAGGEKGILGWRPGETVTLTVTSGELASLAITDADGNEIAYENADGKQSYRFKMPNCIVNIKAKYFANWPTKGTGTANDPYILSSTEDWKELGHNIYCGRTYKGQYIKMTQDIAVSTMVGMNEVHSFQGTFSGDGHQLDVNIEGSEEGMAPFHYIKDATIKDLRVTGKVTATANHASGLVGFADGTNLIERCTVGTWVYYEADWVGGVVGHGKRSKTTIRNCVFSGIIWHLFAQFTRGCAGVFWGWSESDATPILENCIESARNYMAIKQFHPLGVNGGNGTVTDCYYVTPPDDGVPNPCPISGAVQVTTAAPAGGIYRYARVNDLSVYSGACTVSGIGSDYDVEKGAVSITPVVTATTGAALALGTDYTATLNGNAVTSLPISISMAGNYELTLAGKGRYAGSASYKFTATAPTTGSGTADDPYLINSASDWNMLSVNVAKGQNYSGQYVKLTADIEITDVVGVYEGKPFSGTFLGEGHTLTANIKNTDSGKGGMAPFRYVKDATIRDVTVGGTIESNGRHATGLVGFADGTNLIEGCTVNATLNISTDYAGGIVGHGLASATTIRNCVFAGTFNNVGGNPTNIGAIWGWSDSGKPVLENCLEKGTYKNISSMHPMGLQNGTGTITNCYYLTPQIGSPDRACTVSGACQLSATNTGDGIYRQITLTDCTYYIVCYFSGVERRYLYTGSDISVAPTVTAADGTKLTAGTDFTYTPETVREMGDYTLTISGKGSYTGTKTFPISVSDQREVTSKSTVLTTGEYTVFEDVTIAERITIDGSVVLNLGENAKLKVPKGIELSKGNSLTINGPGSLNIGVVETDKSGIGAVEVGTLVINSGSIEISAFSAGAAIGGDRNNTSGGSITINGGKISIVNTRGKCIGGGYDDDRKGQYGVCGDIVINGGQLDLGSIIGFFGPSIHSDDVKYNSGTLTLGWTNPDDYIRTVNILGSASDLSLERISFVEGRPFVLDGTTTVATADNIVGTKLVPLLALADNRDNSETLSRYAGAQLPVQLDGRTLYRDGSWNTLCLPFSVKLSGSPLEGATARPLTSASISGTTLNLSFGSAVTELVAGTPYIIKWAGGEPIVSPVFSPVSIDKTDRSYDNGAAGDARVRFIGTYNSLTFDSDDKSILFMGGASKLHYPAKGASIGAQRAYFKIGEDGAASNARIASFNIDFGEGEATGIQEIVNSKSVNSQSDGWYTLDGRQLDGKPTQSGVYINGGRKVVIK